MKLGMRVISWNVCGLRSAYEKGFSDELKRIDADLICLQEIRASGVALPLDLAALGYQAYPNPSRRRGFHGTAVMARLRPLRVSRSLGHPRFDSEGRFMMWDFPDFVLINVYMPHGGRGKRDMGYKLEAYDALLEYLSGLSSANIILAGDFNVARESIDLARPRENVNNTMFMPAERGRLAKLIELGFVDSFREFCRGEGHYTRWPRSYGARKRNLGWRIDHIFVSQALKDRLWDAFILPEVRGSDHCPVGVDVEI